MSTGTPDVEELNKLIRFTMWSVFRVGDITALDRVAAKDELVSLLDAAAEKGTVTRASTTCKGSALMPTSCSGGSRTPRSSSRRSTPISVALRWAGRALRCGRRSVSTVRQSSTGPRPCLPGG